MILSDVMLLKALQILVVYKYVQKYTKMYTITCTASYNLLILNNKELKGIKKNDKEQKRIFIVTARCSLYPHFFQKHVTNNLASYSQS